MSPTDKKFVSRAGLKLAAALDAFAAIDKFPEAILSCRLAKELTPDDPHLEEILDDMSARYTIHKGKYDQEGDFTQSIKDLDKQKELMQKDAMVQETSYLDRQIERARTEYLDTPAQPGKVNGYVDALLKYEDDAHETQAIEVLTKAHTDIGAYQFKMRIGDIRIRQLIRRYREILEKGDKAAAAEAARQQLTFELEEYAERAVNYPTDMAIKYELGRRQFLAGNYDDAIGSLQQAQRDPRRQVLALTYMGQAFAKKDWHKEAAETFARALELELPEERAKTLRYYLGDVLEKMDNIQEALDQFSQVAQMDFNYRDVRDRVEKLRSQEQAGSSE